MLQACEKAEPLPDRRREASRDKLYGLVDGDKVDQLELSPLGFERGRIRAR